MAATTEAVYAAPDVLSTMVIEELAPAAGAPGGGAAPARWEWTRDNRALPREGWPGGLHLRKNRSENPGSDEVVEQVLGPSWKPFTLVGEWDDRFGGAGFAQAQLDSWRKQLFRGSLVRITMGVESIVCSLDDFDWQRLRVRADGTWWRVGYSIAFSPHRMTEGGDARRENRAAPQKTASSAEHEAKIRELVALMAAAQAAQGAQIAIALAGNIHAAVTATVEQVLQAADRLGVVIDSSASATTASATLGRVGDQARKAVQAFYDVGTAALAVHAAARAADPSTGLGWESVQYCLLWVSWIHELERLALLLWAASWEAFQVLGARINPDAIALYRPSSNELLASISLRYYQTPHRWPDIMRRNGLRSPVLTGNELLVIPR